MNNDLISREALRKAFNERINANGFMTTEELLGIIDNAPSVTPTFGLFKEMLCSECDKRPQGKWLETNELIGTHLHSVLMCSVCGARAVDKLNFCPDCGADMRKGGEL